MAETQEARDKKMRGIRSNRANESKICIISRTREMIWDLEHYGPTGLMHIAILNGIIGKSIRVWNADGSLNRIIGEKEVEQPIDVEYHAIGPESIGHWTLRQAKDPSNTEIDLNSCLFSVIGFQTGQTPTVLRKWTIVKLKNKLRQLADRLDEILQLEENDARMAEWLMIGGARYIGTSYIDAAKILDDSQKGVCFQTEVCKIFDGHPRGHAPSSSTMPLTPTNNIEAFSLEEDKTGFLSREDQDKIAHLVLQSRKVRKAMNKLNYGDDVKRLSIEAAELIKVNNELPIESRVLNNGNLPKGIQYKEGKAVGGEKDIVMVTIVLRHHKCAFCVKDADVFVITLFPNLSK